MPTGFTINGKSVPVPSGIPTGGIAENQKLIQNTITLFIVVAVMITLLFLIWGGILWITSGGDKAKIQAARNRIIYAIIGVIIVFMSFAIINVVGYLFNVNLLSVTLPQ
jgi:ABC-type Mn2+/Zn2+ transport system permease subunit